MGRFQMQQRRIAGGFGQCSFTWTGHVSSSPCSISKANMRCIASRRGIP
jgi:hypothetical protein